jgi:hypothetical protein
MYCSLGPSDGLSFQTDQDRVISIHAYRDTAVPDLELPMGLSFGTSMIETLDQLCKRGDGRWVVRTPPSRETTVLSLALHAYAGKPIRFTIGLTFQLDVLTGLTLQEIEDYGPVQ